jgi:hypothetical protein
MEDNAQYKFPNPGDKPQPKNEDKVEVNANVTVGSFTHVNMAYPQICYCHYIRIRLILSCLPKGLAHK